MNRPLILVPCSEQNIPGDPTRLYVNRAYATSIEHAGGIPLCIARPDEEAVNELIALGSGLYLTGGGDIDPKLYGEETHRDAGNDIPDTARDTLEFLLIKKALEQKMPILGICRGMQNLNVHFGGTLYQDLKKEFGGKTDHDHRNTTDRGATAHEVQVKRNTQYGHIVSEEMIEANSMHHQGIRSLGKELTATGHTPDGLIEAFEHPDFPFCIGVQWHPEELRDAPSQKLFESFIAACRAYKK